MATADLVVCPLCGTVNQGAAAFCENCGARLSVGAGAPSAPAAAPPAAAPAPTPEWFRAASPDAYGASTSAWDDPRVGSRRVYATFWRRVGAALIDFAITVVPFIVVWVMVLIVANDRSAQFVATVLSALYYWIGNSLGGTLGKRVVGIRVINEAGGAPGLGPGFVRSLIPNWLPLVYALLPVGGVITAVLGLLQLFDVLSMIRNERKQTLHDRLAGTYVVRV